MERRSFPKVYPISVKTETDSSFCARVWIAKMRTNMTNRNFELRDFIQFVSPYYPYEFPSLKIVACHWQDSSTKRVGHLYTSYVTSTTRSDTKNKREPSIFSFVKLNTPWYLLQCNGRISLENCKHPWISVKLVLGWNSIKKPTKKKHCENVRGECFVLFGNEKHHLVRKDRQPRPVCRKTFNNDR